MNFREARGPGPGRDREAGPSAEPDLGGLLAHVARGDQAAFEQVYDRLAGPVYGLIRRVLRDPAQSEEVAQEVLLEVWRTASRFDPSRGSATTWVMTIAHRRAIDRIRSVTAEASGTRSPRPPRWCPPRTRWPRRWRATWTASGSAAAWAR